MEDVNHVVEDDNVGRRKAGEEAFLDAKWKFG